jgi:hypothetical protein
LEGDAEQEARGLEDCRFSVCATKTGKRRNLGTFKSRAAAEKHERDVQYFKRH